MAELQQAVLVLVAVFLLEFFIYNILVPNLPKLPGDLFLDKAGFRVYIPFVSALLLAATLTVLHRLLG